MIELHSHLVDYRVGFQQFTPPDMSENELTQLKLSYTDSTRHQWRPRPVSVKLWMEVERGIPVKKPLNPIHPKKITGRSSSSLTDKCQLNLTGSRCCVPMRVFISEFECNVGGGVDEGLSWASSSHSDPVNHSGTDSGKDPLTKPSLSASWNAPSGNTATGRRQRTARPQVQASRGPTTKEQQNKI